MHLISLNLAIRHMIVFTQIDKDLERPGVMDWLKDGLSRVWGFTSPFGSRQIMIWNLIPPSALHSVLHYVIVSVAQHNVAQVLQKQSRTAQLVRAHALLSNKKAQTNVITSLFILGHLQIRSRK